LILGVIAGCGLDYGPPATAASIDLYPAISADGRRLVYSRYGAALPPTLHRTRIGTFSAELLMAQEAQADWSPDGRSVSLRARA
jgi:hypothetical protein